MKNALADFVASGGFKGVSYSVNGRSIQYRTIDEFKAGIEWVKTLAEQESGAAVGRTYAKNGGGGRW